MRRPSWTQQASQSSLDDFIAACKDGNVEEVRRIYKENPGLDVNRGSTHGSKALPLAAGNGLADLVRALLELGCNPDNRNRSGNTAAHLAAFCDHVHVLEVLAGHGANLLIKDRTGQTPLDVAVARKSQGTIDAWTELLERAKSVKQLGRGYSFQPPAMLRKNSFPHVGGTPAAATTNAPDGASSDGPGDAAAEETTARSQEVRALQRQLQQAEQGRSNLQARHKQFKDSEAELKQRLAQVDHDKASLQTQLEQARAHNAELEQQLNAAKAMIKQAESAHLAVSEQLQQSREALRKHKAEAAISP